MAARLSKHASEQKDESAASAQDGDSCSPAQAPLTRLVPAAGTSHAVSLHMQPDAMHAAGSTRQLASLSSQCPHAPHPETEHPYIESQEKWDSPPLHARARLVR